MQIFEYPYVIITILVLFFIILGAVGIYFAMRGVKTANGNEENDFVNLAKLEKCFEKSGRLREDRTVLYCNVDLDKYLSRIIQMQNLENEKSREKDIMKTLYAVSL